MTAQSDEPRALIKAPLLGAVPYSNFDNGSGKSFHTTGDHDRAQHRTNDPTPDYSRNLLTIAIIRLNC